MKESEPLSKKLTCYGKWQASVKCSACMDEGKCKILTGNKYIKEEDKKEK